MSAAKRQPADQAVRDQIIQRLDRNACVEAGAGTGKTTVLVARIVELLRTETVAVDELAVITFTEKAAAELSVRVRQRLEEALLDAAPGSPEAAALHRALGGLHRARIETIHAFAGGLLRERPVEAGLDPQFTVVDQLGASLDFDTAYEQWIVELLDRNDPRVAQALNRTMRLDHIRQLAEELNDHRDVLPLAPLPGAGADLDEYLAVFDAAVASITRASNEFDLPEDDGGVQQLPWIQQFIDRVATTRGQPEDLERVLADAPVFKRKGAQKNWDDPEGCRLLKSATGELGDANAAVKDALRTEAVAAIMPLVEEFVVAFAAERRRNARLTFDDLLLWARELVAEHPDVREDFRRQYRAILVDEFQDTDPVQADLVLHLSSAGPELDPRKLTPEPGRLVVVGDPKQSIYRFRRADIALYDAIKRGPLADDLLQISQNFRSSDGILEWANGVFDRVLVEEQGVQPRNVPLQTSGAIVGVSRSPVLVVHGATEHDDPAEAARGRREQEGRLLAAVFAQAKSEGWPVRDRESGVERPATWRDMAVLVPSRTEVETYEAAFAAAGVPLRHEGGKTFFRRQEVRELCSCLLAIDDPGNRVALVAALRSPVLGCSDEELFLWTVNGGSWTYLGGAVDGEGGPERVRDALRLLRELHRARAGLSLPELVRRVLDDTGAVEHALTQPQGRETAANLLKLVDQARDFGASGGGGLRAFTRWLARNRDEESEETDAGVSEETDDVVRLITIHGAKGLEFPIVGLANLHSRGSNQFRPIPDAEGHRLHVRLGVGTKGGYFTTPGLDDAKEREKKFSAAERLRLLYVGVTRARDHLVVPWVGKAEGMLGALADSLPSVDADAEMATELGVHVVDRATLTLDPDAPDERGRDPRVPKKELTSAVDRAAAWETERVDLLTAAGVELPLVTATSLEKPWRPVVASAEAPDASMILGEGPPLALGDAVHRVMQLVTFPGAEDLEEVVAAICSEGELDEFQDEVLRLTQRCLESPAVVAAQSADQVIRELPFTVQGSDGEGYVTGRIDLLYRVEDDWTVVDYKTDTVEDGALAATASAHEAQVSAYVEATRVLVGVAPRVVLIYPRVGGEVVFAQVEATGDLAQAIRPG